VLEFPFADLAGPGDLDAGYGRYRDRDEVGAVGSRLGPSARAWRGAAAMPGARAAGARPRQAAPGRPADLTGPASPGWRDRIGASSRRETAPGGRSCINHTPAEQPPLARCPYYYDIGVPLMSSWQHRWTIDVVGRVPGGRRAEAGGTGRGRRGSSAGTWRTAATGRSDSLPNGSGKHPATANRLPPSG
jgi:hypothetical protein